MMWLVYKLTWHWDIGAKPYTATAFVPFHDGSVTLYKHIPVLREYEISDCVWLIPGTYNE
jgi:hypothetical protein